MFTFKKYGILDVCHYKHLKKEQEQPYENRSGHHEGPGLLHRLGMDRWMWQKVGNHIYEEYINCFFHSEKPPAPPALPAPPTPDSQQ